MTEKSILRGTAAVTLGTLVVQVGGVLGQFLYALWLVPADFGIWATASASVVLLGAFANAGEANAYLAGASHGLGGGPIQRTIRFNLGLSGIALLVAGAYMLSGRGEIALLVCILSVDLPLQGLGNMFIAAYIKARRRRQLVGIQSAATVLRLLVGLGAVLLWQSPVAIALALLANSAAVVVLARIVAARHAEEVLRRSGAAVAAWRLRLDRAIHQFTQVLPSQVDYLTVSFLATPAMLGLYYFAYQATSALSGVLAGPLSKTAMAELAVLEPSRRVGVLARLLGLVAGSTAAVAAIVGVGMSYLSGLLPVEWAGVVGPFVILLASLPARFMTPLSEALNMVNGEWRRSSGVNLIDAVGTAAACAFAITGSVTMLAIAVALWKVLFGCMRSLLVLEGIRLRCFLLVVLPCVASVAMTAASLVGLGRMHWVAGLAVVCLSAGQLMLRPLLTSASSASREDSERNLLGRY